MSAADSDRAHASAIAPDAIPTAAADVPMLVGGPAVLDTSIADAEGDESIDIVSVGDGSPPLSVSDSEDTEPLATAGGADAASAEVRAPAPSPSEVDDPQDGCEPSVPKRRKENGTGNDAAGRSSSPVF